MKLNTLKKQKLDASPKMSSGIVDESGPLTQINSPSNSGKGAEMMTTAGDGAK